MRERFHSGDVVVKTVTGREAIAALIPDLARLRMEVFRAWPYLYEGSLAYEEEYLKDFAGAEDAVVVTALNGNGTMMGCSTGSAITDHHTEFSGALARAGYDLPSTFYFGESVLLASCRGQGLGHAFFDEREAHARQRGYRRACFCAVQRPSDHPARPAGYRPLDPFWTARGYTPVPGLTAPFEWQDVGENQPSKKPMQFWMRDL